MIDPNTLMERAQNSKFYLQLLNWAMDHMVPFNKPHGFRIKEISNYHIRTTIPFKKRNLNHIKGLHATALATLSEYTTGVLLLHALGAKKYRIILQRLDISYHYQGKMAAEANFSFDQQWLEANIHTPLQHQDSVVVPCEVHIDDLKANRLTSATIYWQLKPWGKVKTTI